MLKLNEPIPITEYGITELNEVKMKLLSANGHLLMISDFKYTTKVEKEKLSIWAFRRPKMVTNYYITDIKIWGWSKKAKVWGSMVDESHITLLILLRDLRSMRQDFLDNIVAPLEELGVKFNLRKTPE